MHVLCICDVLLHGVCILVQSMYSCMYRTRVRVYACMRVCGTVG